MANGEIGDRKVHLEFAAESAPARRVTRWPLAAWLVSTFWFFVPWRGPETASEHRLRVAYEDARHQLDLEQKRNAAKEVELLSLARIVAYHEARWKALAEQAAIRSSQPRR